jgi:hypothetical protein
VPHLRRGPRFVLEPLSIGDVACELGPQRFERDREVVPLAQRAIHNARSAFAEHLLEPIPTNPAPLFHEAPGHYVL